MKHEQFPARIKELYHPPQNKFQENDRCHEIYLNDPSRAAPKKLKIVIRQPVK